MSAIEKQWIMTVDENAVIRNALKRFLEEETDYGVHIEEGTDFDLVATIRRIRPALLIMDLVFKKVDGLRLLEEVREACPDLPIIVCSMRSEARYAEPSLVAGANGYVMKMDTVEFILPAIHQVLRGETYLSNTYREKQLKRAAHS